MTGQHKSTYSNTPLYYSQRHQCSKNKPSPVHNRIIIT